MSKVINKFKKTLLICEPALDWWASLSIEEKNLAKDHFEKVRLWNLTRKGVKYPNMYDLTDYRLSQLNEKHISRIHVFKDHQI